MNTFLIFSPIKRGCLRSIIIFTTKIMKNVKNSKKNPAIWTNPTRVESNTTLIILLLPPCFKSAMNAAMANGKKA